MSKPTEITVKLSLTERLNNLYATRRDKQDARQDDPQLYFDIVREISTTILRIREEFPTRIDQCSLFAYIKKEGEIDEKWRTDFEANFYKLFIDRRSCRNKIDNPHLQFNNPSHVEKTGADLCYSEGYALAFLLMLMEVERYFEKHAKEEKLPEKTFDELLQLMYRFNEIMTGKKREDVEEDGNEFGAEVHYSELEKRMRLQKRHGYFFAFYNFSDSNFLMQISEGYEHLECAKARYEDYLKEIAKEGSNKEVREKAALTLSSLLPTMLHISHDGNARTANVLCNMLALLHNNNFLVAFSPYFLDGKIVSEARKWTQNFYASPAETPSATLEGKKAYTDLAKANYSSKHHEQMTSLFICDLFSQSGKAKKEDIFFQIPIDFEEVFFCGTSLEIDDTFIITNESRHQMKEGRAEFDFLELSEVVEQKSDDITKSADRETYNSRIALNFLKHVLQPEKQGSLLQLRPLINIILQIHKPENFVGEDKEEYEQLHQNCCKKIQPQETTKRVTFRPLTLGQAPNIGPKK